MDNSQQEELHGQQLSREELPRQKFQAVGCNLTVDNLRKDGLPFTADCPVCKDDFKILCRVINHQGKTSNSNSYLILYVLAKISEDLRIRFIQSENTNIIKNLRIPVSRVGEQSYHQQISSYCQLNYPVNGINYSHFELKNEDDEIIANIPAEPLNSIQLTFSLPSTIIPESASNWKETYLVQLGIEFIPASNIADFFTAYTEVDITPSQVASCLVTDLLPLNHVFVQEFCNNKDVSEEIDILLTDDVVRSICMLKKFARVEAAVDLFVVFLLRRLGFYNGRLYAFPQLPLKLYFGEIVKEAIPDFTVLDMLSYYKIAVIHDKSESESDNPVSVEAQLIAEVIAMYQGNRQNSRKRAYRSIADQPPDHEKVLAVKVKGSVFTFYCVPVTQDILNALDTRSATTTKTSVTFMGELDFLVKSDREKIINILDIYCKIASAPHS